MADAGRDALERWLRDVMRRQGWSAEAWARHAKVSATSITRFLRDAKASWPSSRTLLALARAAGTTLPIGGNTAPPVSRIPILPLHQLIENDDLSEVIAKKRWPQLVVADPIPPGCVAFHVVDDSLEAAGVLEADTIVVDPGAVPSHGDLVVFSTGQVVRGAAYTDHGCVERRMAPGEPMVWPLHLVKIIGVIRKVFRDYPL